MHFLLHLHRVHPRGVPVGEWLRLQIITLNDIFLNEVIKDVRFLYKVIGTSSMTRYSLFEYTDRWLVLCVICIMLVTFFFFRPPPVVLVEIIFSSGTAKSNANFFVYICERWMVPRSSLNFLFRKESHCEVDFFAELLENFCDAYFCCEDSKLCEPNEMGRSPKAHCWDPDFWFIFGFGVLMNAIIVPVFIDLFYNANDRAMLNFLDTI